MHADRAFLARGDDGSSASRFGLLILRPCGERVALFAERARPVRPGPHARAVLAVAIIVLGLAAQLGALSLLATFLGFLLARTVALRAARSAE